MAANKDKFSRMLEELAKEYPEVAEDAMALQSAIESPEGEDFMLDDEFDADPDALPPELADDEDEFMMDDEDEELF